ncbi:MAG: tRNA (adenosine(37)-N6)-threonylcarbamoyltransferase complex ATPase subunit type 1 TsaE, partial [Chitinophagaceae bacterium]
MEWIFTLDEIQRVAEEFWQKVGDANIFAFHGNLGAGKTTFIAALCRAKGVKDTTSSPTFALINDYLYNNASGKEQHIFHLDLYRIRDEEEAIQAGIEDTLYSGAICM